MVNMLPMMATVGEKDSGDDDERFLSIMCSPFDLFVLYCQLPISFLFFDGYCPRSLIEI
jgi:hypothetical protein